MYDVCPYFGTFPAFTTSQTLNRLWLSRLLYTGSDLCGDRGCPGGRRCRTTLTCTSCVMNWSSQLDPELTTATLQLLVLYTGSGVSQGWWSQWECIL